MKIICEHTGNLSARLIQIWMIADSLIHFKKPTFIYNHSLIEHNGWIYEAIDKGVVCWPFAEHYSQEKYKKAFKVREIELPFNAEETAKVLTYINRQVGKKYEFANFLFHILKTFGCWKGSKSDKKLYCYELVIRAINASGKYSIDPFLNPREFCELTF